MPRPTGNDDQATSSEASRSDPFVELALQTVEDPTDSPEFDHAKHELERQRRRGKLLEWRTPAEMPIGSFAQEVLSPYLKRMISTRSLPRVQSMLMLSEHFLVSRDPEAVETAQRLLRTRIFATAGTDVVALLGERSRAYVDELELEWEPWWPVARILDGLFAEVLAAVHAVHPSIDFESARNVGLPALHFHDYLALYWNRAQQENEDAFLEFTVGPNRKVTGDLRWPDGPDRDYARFQLTHWSDQPSVALGPIFLSDDGFTHEYMEAVQRVARNAVDMARGALDELVEALSNPSPDGSSS